MPNKKPEGELEKLKARYREAMDAVAIGTAMNLDRDKPLGSPKSLRFGVVAAQVSLAALVRVLKDKGIIGHEEHLEALAVAAETEQQSCEQMLTARYGREVSLGHRGKG